MTRSVASMAREAIDSRGLKAGVLAAWRERSEATRYALRTFAWTRALVAVVAVFAAVSLGPAGGGAGARNAAKFDEPALTHPLGGFGDVALAPLARWDAVWYLRIADSGYADPVTGDVGPRAAFFPAYPVLARGLAVLGGGSRGALLIASYLVALAAFLAALVLLYRLTELELGRDVARPTVLLLAVFPGALFFGAPYSESLFLLVSVGAFYAARTGRWPVAGALAAVASGCRSAGILLLVPLLLLYLYGPRADRGPDPAARGVRPRFRVGGDVAWLALAPAGLAAYSAYLGLHHGDALAFLHLQDAWFREFAGPLGGAWHGVVAAFEGARQLLSGSRDVVYFQEAGGDPMRVAGMNLMLFGFLCFAVVAAVGVLRRLPVAYGAYVVVALLLPLSFPVGPQPLMSLPRFTAVLFPVFMWLGLVCRERRIVDQAAAASALGLGLFVVEFASWRFIA